MTPLKLIVPIQSSLTITLPGKNIPYVEHKPFPDDLPTIHCMLRNLLELSHCLAFVDDVEVMNSLQRPRKIGIIGSDGKTYFFLCKPKDDMRKDNRVLEFYNLINKLLQRCPESRKRRLSKLAQGLKV